MHLEGLRRGSVDMIGLGVNNVMVSQSSDTSLSRVIYAFNSWCWGLVGRYIQEYNLSPKDALSGSYITSFLTSKLVSKW